MTAFLILGIVGLAFLVLSALLDSLFDGVFHAFHLDFFPDGLFSGVTVSSFVAAFGFGGVFALSTLQASMPVAYAVAIGTGLVIAVGAYLITKFFRNSEDASGANETSALVGKSGYIITPAAAGNYGEISINLNGHPTKTTVLSDVDLVRGQKVTVDAVLSATSLKVSPTVTPVPTTTTTTKESM